MALFKSTAVSKYRREDFFVIDEFIKKNRTEQVSGWKKGKKKYSNATVSHMINFLIILALFP
jgi:hypothetical protein